MGVRQKRGGGWGERRGREGRGEEEKKGKREGGTVDVALAVGPGWGVRAT